MAITLDQVVAQVTDLVVMWTANQEQFADWMAGPATGGWNSTGTTPGGGYYPLTNSQDVTIYAPSIAKIMDAVVGPAAQAMAALAATNERLAEAEQALTDIQVALTTLIGYRDAAAASAQAADDSEAAAKTSELAAQAAQALTEAARDAAAQSEANALSYRNAAQAAQVAAETAESNAETAAADADADRIAAQTARTGAEAAQLAAETAQAAAEAAETDLEAARDAAAASAAAALTSEQNADASEAAALASKNAAATSETNAAASEDAAAASQADALASKNAAHDSEVAAAASETVATQKAADAASSEAAAQASEEAAATSATLASQKAQEALDSATAAATSESNAAASESAAAASQVAAATSEANAATSEQNADDSEAMALSAKNAAQLAQTAAEDAKALAEAARDAAIEIVDFDPADYQLRAEKGQPNGYAALDANGKVPLSQLDTDTLGGLKYMGVWNASTNTPAIPAAAGNNKGQYYKVSVAGSTSINGTTDWGVGDWLVSNGIAWDKLDNSEPVSSVAGKTGAVTLVKGDVGLGNVDNTSDANKPVSTAQQAALDLKVSKASKSTTGQAQAGTDDESWMTPSKTKDAILAIAGSGVEQFSISVVATGAPQTVDLGQALQLSELLIFENGVEQDGSDITVNDTEVTFTRPAGAKMRFMLSGGYKGRAFEGDARGLLADRDTYDTAPVNFCYLATDAGAFYFRTGASGWSAAYPIRGPQGEPGIDGVDGADAINPLEPWQKKTANFAASDRGRYYVTGAAITMTLPASGDGKEVWVRGNFKTNTMVVDRNGAQIVNKDGVAVTENLTLNANNICAKFVCFDGAWTVSQ